MAPHVEPTLGRWFTAPFRARRKDMMSRVGALIASTPPQGYIGCCHAIPKINVTDRLGGVTCSGARHRGRGGSRHAGRDGARHSRRAARRRAGDPALGLAPLESRAAGGIQPGPAALPGQGLRPEPALGRTALDAAGPRGGAARQDGAPLGGTRSLHLRLAPPRQSRPRADLVRGDGSGARVDADVLAEPAGIPRALRRLRHPSGARSLGALSPPDPAHAGVGGAAARVRPVHPRLASVAHRGDTSHRRAARHLAFVREVAAVLLGRGPAGGPAAGRPAPDRLDARVHGAALLAALPALVRATRAGSVRARPARARARAARLRGGRARGGGAVPGPSRLRAGAHAHAGAGDAGAARGARAGAARDARLVRRGAGGGARGARRPRASAAAARHDPRQLPRAPRGGGAAGLVGARGQPLRARPARLGVRRAGPLLHVPDPGAG